MTRATVLAVCLIALFAIAGCRSPSPTYYVMHGDAQRADPPVPATMTVVVSPVTVPDVVDRPQIVTRTADNRIELNEYERWAEPLKTDIARVIAADLAQRLTTARVSLYDLGAGAPPEWRVRVDIMSIDSVPGDAVTIDAQWAVRPPASGTTVVGKTVAREPVDGKDYGALVAAHERALGVISTDIAAAIRAGQAH
ncbi:PqiC family protein [Paraburkholderia dinghuensis]|uniref:Membrane integrity-associated transporter subunit PqiC n=1 Tax=Paraburkholderia dinghuensis TaxID=2305225 RepID=A0A3N6NDF8_9BURK|nr:PqiC family protein [Paraburkholderia dinghuensis]RQH07022.1 membrane integrity-associated transporter subunit PqiC [Paraburkholderia dinghuensis]